jgi:hypothetical protein
MQAYNKNGSTSSFIAEKKAPKPRQLLSMTLHHGYPTVTQDHWRTGLTLVARPNITHRSHPYSPKLSNPALNHANRVKGPCRS